ncbi:hypothetical protein GGR51DRAFT_553182 [Nemania sp. FL0031]|nr:hypothetical protein GGR51DRAFT_553182 [Nemania sp. FL0031]
MDSTNPQLPFPSSCAINKDVFRPLPSSIPSSRSKLQLDSEDDPVDYLPGNPAVPLVADEIYALWLVGRKVGKHIDELHTHRVKGRAIVPTEDPKLHLIWDYNKVPIPAALLNYDVWATYLSSIELYPPVKSSIGFDRSVAIGFLRSYAFLVSHPLDLAIAHQSHLMPPEVIWLQWSKFIIHFRRVEDKDVAKRYHYGQLRLLRLHWVVRIFRPRHSIHDFIANYTLSLAFAFATVSLALSSMQVALSVPAEALWFKQPNYNLHHMDRAFWVFSIVVLLSLVVLWLLFLVIPFLVLAHQLTWGYKHRDKPSRQGGAGA